MLIQSSLRGRQIDPVSQLLDQEKDLHATVCCFDLDPANWTDANVDAVVAGLKQHSMNFERDLLVVESTFPCTANSKAGSRPDNSGLEKLTYSAPALMEKLLARGIKKLVSIAENVDGFRDKWDHETGSMLAAELSRRMLALKFAVRHFMCDAASFGASQTRKRYLQLGAAPGVPLPRCPSATVAEGEPFENLHQLSPREAVEALEFRVFPFTGKNQKDLFRREAETRFGTAIERITFIRTKNQIAKRLCQTLLASYGRCFQQVLLIPAPECQSSLVIYFKKPRCHPASHLRRRVETKRARNGMKT
jgi:site-specific DNA-cytosine methylase